ncbi:Six-bladed beta-propeller, TolB-like protein [Corchorus olitorius]|uniref:Six-bladed beta-propeller, TolB-like protein n=1 Tax=Corchorus olitorius TaxID=93759 RepID=A0A1R3KF28_9ROSI|nr:Six-bladed beta-propeller, TolB-like protein [Corchorus olitorius]
MTSISSSMRMKTMAAPIFSILFLVLCSSSMVLSVSFNRIQLPPNATGPEALAFEPKTGIFYTGIADGRVLKYRPRVGRFEDLGFFAPNRSKAVCDGTETAMPNPVCGRPLGMGFHHATKRLYVCDAFFGFGVLEPKGGLGTLLSTGADGERYRFCNVVDVHQRPVGVAVDEDAKFVFISLFIINKTIKFWLKGPNSKANKYEIINSVAMPDNIKRTESGRSFWLAAAMEKQSSLVPIGKRFNENGIVLQTVNFEQVYGNKSISEVQEYQGRLYAVSRFANFIPVLKDLKFKLLAACPEKCINCS